MIALLLATGLANAGACCVGTTSAAPTRLGACEHAMVGLSVQGEGSASRWDRRGQVRSSSLKEVSTTATLSLGLALSRRTQLGATLPVLHTWKFTPKRATHGGGVADARLLGRYNIQLERPSFEERRGRAGLWLTAGARLPTGRDMHAGVDALMADVTGRPGSSVLVGILAERTMDRTPWLASLTTEVGADELAITGSAGIGRSFGDRVTGLASLGHTMTAVYGAGVTDRTSVSGRLVVGRRLRWRAWGGALADLPIPGLGREQAHRLSLSGGVALVR